MLIAIDWGTSNLRAFLLDKTQQIAEPRSIEAGILQVQDKQYSPVLENLTGDWLLNYPDAPILLCGMIGSQQGWVEVPYVPCPLNIRTLGAQLHGLPSEMHSLQRTITFVPGLMTQNQQGHIDIMRGEETQIIGALQLLGSNQMYKDEQLICLPGTHAKWLHLKNGILSTFNTVMTGEVFAVLKQYSLLGRLFKTPQTDFYQEAFLRGVALTKQAGGLLNHLFSVRTALLFQKIKPEEGADYLSGILIGHECATMRQQYDFLDSVLLIGSSALTIRYQNACEYFGLSVSSIEGDEAVVAGLSHLAIEGGLL